MKDDMISRQAAIDFVDAGHLVNPNEPRWSDNEVVNFLKSRPSAQPDSKETSSTHKALDTISRQAAVDAVSNMLRRKFGIGGDLAEITLAGLPWRT